MLNKELEHTLNAAYKFAKEKRHEFLTVEHLLLSLLDNQAALLTLQACNANVTRLRKKLVNFVMQTTPVIPENIVDRDTQPTLGFQRVLQRAVFQVQSAGKIEVSGANVLAAIFSEQESQSVYFLKQESVSRLDVLNYIAHGISRNPEIKSQLPLEERINEEDGGETGERNQEQSGFLAQFTTNLNNKAKLGKIEPLIGREEELSRTIQVLCRRNKNNPLFVGEAGVGKTALAEGLARLIVENKVPPLLQKATIYSLDLGGLLAGTKYRGDFEKRLKGLIDELSKDSGAILFIDEIHTIIGAGAASGGVMDVSNLIKPLLTNGILKCMGSTTYQEYRSIFEKDHALARRFQKIDIVEPTIEQTVQILQGLKTYYERHHLVKYSDGAVRSAAELASRYITDRFMPDKAIDVIDEAGAYHSLLPAEKRTGIIDQREIETVVAKIARIPERNISSSDKAKLKNLDRDLKMLVFGQASAIDGLVSAIKLARSGLREEKKPVGCFLFAGPTGVGKTEVTVQLAKLMGVELIRFDMSEYMERHTVSRLIGAPPGYVGYDKGGLLTDEVMKHPYSVILLDEIEKAHPDVYNILLQVMDHGTLTDTNGRKADFRNTIIVMTTNAGAEMISRPAIGFTPQDQTHDNMEAIKRTFSPEFRNRLDSIICFKPLDHIIIASVVNKFILELEMQLEEKGVVLHIDEAARMWLAEHGYDEKMGARPMARLIQEKLKKPLADELLFGRLAEGGRVEVSVNQGELIVTIEEAVV